MERSMAVELQSDSMERTGERASLGVYYRLTKPGIVFANLLGTVAGFLLAMKGAPFTPDLMVTFFFSLLGIALVIAGGTTLNNVIDRDIDGYMERTKDRPIHSGRVSVKAATFFGLSLAVTGEAVLAFGVHPQAALLALIGFVVYVIIYTLWLKRITTLNTVIGGISGAVPTVMGYVAVTGRMDLTAWILFSILFLWQPPHFLALAMRRHTDYKNACVPMLPNVKGFGEAKKQIFYYTVSLFPVSLMLYPLRAVGWLYLVGALLLGTVYLIKAYQGLHRRGEEEKRWASFMFRYSIIYLTLLYLLMMVDAA
ncbi:heme o synthase [Thermicanus aegyptius]|uniref:heme o synthase n=1 Tax=Thermicanus aegyptius TaxID=94009 RepID=UPI000429C7D2|nr:heme o synthase [Thermicanus aegyptius]